MNVRTVDFRGGKAVISEYQTTPTGGFIWEAAFVLLRHLEQHGLSKLQLAPPQLVINCSRTETLAVTENGHGTRTANNIGENPTADDRHTDKAEEAAKSSGLKHQDDNCSVRSVRSVRVLDFSGGTGLLGIAAAQLIPSSKVVISEYDASGVEMICHNRDQSGVSPEQCTACRFVWGVTDPSDLRGRRSRRDGHTNTATTATTTTSSNHSPHPSLDHESPPLPFPTSGAAEHSEFDFILCSDCLFITVRDNLECDFVASLVELASPETVILTAHKMRVWDHEKLVVELLSHFFDIRRLPVDPSLKVDFEPVDGGAGMASMFEERAEIFCCEMRLQADVTSKLYPPVEPTADDQTTGPEQHRESYSTRTVIKQHWDAIVAQHNTTMSTVTEP